MPLYLLVDSLPNQGRIVVDHRDQDVGCANSDRDVEVTQSKIDDGKKPLIKEVQVQALPGWWLKVFGNGAALLDEENRLLFPQRQLVRVLKDAKEILQEAGRGM